MNTPTLEKLLGVQPSAGDTQPPSSAAPTRAERDAQDFGSLKDTCDDKVKRFLGREGSLIDLKKLVTNRIHELAVHMDKVTRECLLAHYLPAFVEAQIPDLVGKLSLITECTDKSQVETSVHQVMQGWIDSLWTALLHRCKCNQALGNLPIGIMPYPNDDSLDASREMQVADYMTQVPKALECAQADYLAEVYGLVKLKHE